MSLEITNGHVRVEASPRDDAEIEIVRHAPTNDGLGRLPVEIQEGENEVRIRVVQLEGQTDAAYRSDVTLRVPRDARVDPIRVMEGRLDLSGLTGAVNADIRRGSIAARDLQGSVRLESGIGHVIVEGARLAPTGLLRLRAFNGDVRLSLAEKPQDARILALALNGTIASQIPLSMKETWGPRWGETTLGKGEPVISIDVVTGHIDIRSP